MSCQEIDSGRYFCRTDPVYFAATIDVDIEGELAQPSPTGYRPLPVRDTLFCPTHGTATAQVSPAPPPIVP